MKGLPVVLGFALLLGLPSAPAQDKPAKKKIVFVAGGPSHGYGEHEHYAGCILLAKRLNEGVPGVEAVVHKNGWPKDPSIFDGAAAIAIYCDGAGGHPAVKRRAEIDAMMKKGVGLACIHFGVEVPKGETGDAFLDWIGGYFELNYSVNPHWKAEFKQFPDHPIARGVKPFAINDEWYYNMRFRKDLEGVIPILTAIPPDSTRKGGDSGRGGNDFVRSRIGQPEHVAWACQRPDGGRGFGFTGGHVHWNWGDDNFRKVMLNAILWIARVDVPPEGVPSKTPTREELEENQDEPKPAPKK